MLKPRSWPTGNGIAFRSTVYAHPSTYIPSCCFLHYEEFFFPYANTAHIFSEVASIATVVSKILNNEPLLLNKKIRIKHKI